VEHQNSRPPRARSGSGSLEADVMAVLWAADGPLTPGIVLEQLGRDLAYTTVMTTLLRLYEKEQVDRRRTGRAYAYSPRQRVEEHAAQAMSELLTHGDSAAVLARFVDRLGPEEEALLRKFLEH
jgi:predicted transcriptional regulator